ncbi:KIF-binding protein [Hetaerina americana]|uniref:KIF-binding protein n=1 Tax=Hetaerina americana TaxID=62018 RepID=UPI003A7F127B
MDDHHIELLTTLREKYEKVRRLLEDSKKDPEDDPYHSKYAAREILNDIKSSLVKILDDVGGMGDGEGNGDHLHVPGVFRLSSLLGVMWLNLGTIAVETEEISTGEEQLMQCLKCIPEEKWLEPEAVLVILCTLQQLGILWAQRDNAEKAQGFLERAEKLYNEFRELSSPPPVDMVQLFNFGANKDNGDDNEHNETNKILSGENAMEKAHTHTLYYLAQVYGTLGNTSKSAVYCHTTLKRMLERKEYEVVDWALNSATLSQFFITRNYFKQAKHHLAASSFMLDQFESEVIKEDDRGEELEAKWTNFHHRSADVARCWAKYGLVLLTASRQRLMKLAGEDMDDDDDDENGKSEIEAENEGDNSLLKESTDQLWFTSLELLPYEEQVTDKYALTYEDAKAIFLNAQEWLRKAREFYQFDSHASDHVQIVQDQSQLYKYLAFFEENEDRQCRMHKRRVDLLEPIMKELNPQYYLLVCRQIWFELAEIYSDMMDIKLARMQESDERPTPHALRKINLLAEQSISNFNKYVDSLRIHSTNEMPKKFDEDTVRPVLLAHFYLGRLHSKIIQPDKKAQLENICESINKYKFVVEYCEEHEDAKKVMGVELGISKEMVTLLSLKMDRIKKLLDQQA